MKEISKKAQEMKPGSLLITVSKRIYDTHDKKWRLFDGFRQEFNFGCATVYFHLVKDYKEKDKESMYKNEIESKIESELMSYGRKK